MISQEASSLLSPSTEVDKSGLAWPGNEPVYTDIYTDTFCAFVLVEQLCLLMDML